MFSYDELSVQSKRNCMRPFVLFDFKSFVPPTKTNTLFRLDDETYIINALDRDRVGLAMSIDDASSQSIQDERLLREYWYMFIQQRLEIEEQLLQVPPGICAVYELDRLPVDTQNNIRYAITYTDENTDFYHLSKTRTEWMQLFGDWLFHRGKRPDVLECKNYSYEKICTQLSQEKSRLVCLQDHTRPGKTPESIFYATGMYQTMHLLKSGFRLYNTSSTALYQQQGVAQARHIFRECNMEKSLQSLQQQFALTEEVLLTADQNKISEMRIQCENLIRVCLYKFGQLQAILKVAEVYGDVGFLDEVFKYTKEMERKLTSHYGQQNIQQKAVVPSRSKSNGDDEQIKLLLSLKEQTLVNEQHKINILVQAQHNLTNVCMFQKVNGDSKNDKTKILGDLREHINDISQNIQKYSNTKVLNNSTDNIVIEINASLTEMTILTKQLQSEDIHDIGSEVSETIDPIYVSDSGVTRGLIDEVLVSCRVMRASIQISDADLGSSVKATLRVSVEDFQENLSKLGTSINILIAHYGRVDAKSDVQVQTITHLIREFEEVEKIDVEIGEKIRNNCEDTHDYLPVVLDITKKNVFALLSQIGGKIAENTNLPNAMHQIKLLVQSRKEFIEKLRVEIKDLHSKLHATVMPYLPTSSDIFDRCAGILGSYVNKFHAHLSAKQRQISTAQTLEPVPGKPTAVSAKTPMPSPGSSTSSRSRAASSALSRTSSSSHSSMSRVPSYRSLSAQPAQDNQTQARRVADQITKVLQRITKSKIIEWIQKTNYTYANAIDTLLSLVVEHTLALFNSIEHAETRRTCINILIQGLWMSANPGIVMKINHGNADVKEKARFIVRFTKDCTSYVREIIMQSVADASANDEIGLVHEDALVNDATAKELFESMLGPE